MSTGIVQDSLLGCNRLTKRDTFLDQALMMNVLMHVPSFERVPVPAIVKSPVGPLWTGTRPPRDWGVGDGPARGAGDGGRV